MRDSDWLAGFAPCFGSGDFARCESKKEKFDIFCAYFNIAAKLFRYAGMETCCAICFVFTLISWLICRLIILPIRCILPVYLVAIPIVKEGGIEERYLFGLHACGLIAWVLLAMNIAWFGVILKIALKGLKGEKPHKQSSTISKKSKVT